MTNLALQDLREIFGTTANQFPFDKFISTLDNLFVNIKSIPSLETRNKNGQIRKYKGEYYFSLKSGMNSGNVFFGGNENTPDGKRVPTIKIYKSNRMLQKLPLGFTFPSHDDRSPGRISIILSPETIDFLFDVMQEEITEYNISHEKQLLPASNPLVEIQSPKNKKTTGGIAVLIALSGLLLAIFGGALVGAPLFFLGLFIIFIGLMMSASGAGNSGDAIGTAYSGSSQLICPHCQTKGSVTTRKVTQKSGISGAKATGAILTGGLSMLATGLSRKVDVTESHCTNCNSTWRF